MPEKVVGCYLCKLHPGCTIGSEFAQCQEILCNANRDFNKPAPVEVG